MENRELLEDAAKAAGFRAARIGAHGFEVERNRTFKVNDGPLRDSWGWGLWNPLEDDACALRLFASMPFCELYVSDIGVTVFLPRKPPGEGVNMKCGEYASEHGGDMQAAMRRAIVRAAAAMCPREPRGVSHVDEQRKLK